MEAASNDNVSGITTLLVGGADPNVSTRRNITPLMYAATIDFGDTAVLAELLKAGADRTIRNDDGRTPLEQTHHYKHSLLESLLK